MSTVYLAVIGQDYEGEEVIGVAATLPRAKRAIAERIGVPVRSIPWKRLTPDVLIWRPTREEQAAHSSRTGGDWLSDFYSIDRHNILT